MSNPLDELSNYVKGDDEPVAVTVPPISPAPRASGDNLVTLKERALQGLPGEWRERAIRDAGECGVRHDNDVGWLLIGSSVQSLFCAFAAGDAAQAVQAGVAAIPDQIFSGAVRAGDEVKGALRVEIRERAVEAGQALKMLVDSAASAGATSLKAAATELDVKVGKIPLEVQTQIDAYKQKGAAEFAATAKAAALAAVQANLWAQISRSAMVSVMAFCLACLVGAGGLWGYLLLTHQVMPSGFSAMTDPLGGGSVVKVPTGGAPLQNCGGAGVWVCLRFKSGVPDLP
ncbi:hypothetical protein HF289_08705 [Acidithiobacillus ferrooxidans]|uniref:hypothetical protein n=1 Tax=Acidithiobacillus ferrooxidans TaxID=920 RepID=UPI001C07B978|nr:hypothetical protein [Acidithiobacillus ferrooxidans]MBU2856950.1 hypothetical protein [Acidithiobacillus ferrooxidans]